MITQYCGYSLISGASWTWFLCNRSLKSGASPLGTSLDLVHTTSRSYTGRLASPCLEKQQYLPYRVTRKTEIVLSPATPRLVQISRPILSPCSGVKVSAVSAIN